MESVKLCWFTVMMGEDESGRCHRDGVCDYVVVGEEVRPVIMEHNAGDGVPWERTFELRIFTSSSVMCTLESTAHTDANPTKTGKSVLVVKVDRY